LPTKHANDTNGKVQMVESSADALLSTLSRLFAPAGRGGCLAGNRNLCDDGREYN
jgi:hypothetical protein